MLMDPRREWGGRVRTRAVGQALARAGGQPQVQSAACARSSVGRTRARVARCARARSDRGGCD